MAVKIDEIRSAADRVASSLGLEVVDVEFTGAKKNRTLCVYLEKNADGRAAQAESAMARLRAQQKDIGEEEDAGIKDAIEEDITVDGLAGDEPAVVLPERFAKGELDLRQLSWLTHEDCSAFSRDFSILLDVEDMIPDGEYTLEASSPGLDRKLAGKADFDRFAGNLVKIQTVELIAGDRNWQGKIAATGKDSITIDLTAAKQNSKSRKTGVSTIEIALSNIEKAQLVPVF